MKSLKSNYSVRSSGLSTLRQLVLPVRPPALNQLVITNSQTSDAPKIGPEPHPSPKAIGCAWSFSACKAMLAVSLSLAFLGFSSTVRAQLTISDDFNSGGPDTANGWTAYEGSVNSDDGSHTREVQYTNDPAGSGLVYRLINHAPHNEAGIFTRGASIRNDATYTTSFFVASDVVRWDDTAMIGLAGTFLLAKAQTPGSLTTFGYLTGYLSGGPLAPQGLLGFIEFQSELQATYPDEFTGGFALTPKLDSSKGYRYVFHSGLPADLGGLLIAEMYDRYDLLEPIARGVARDDVNNASHPQGVSGIGNLNVGAKDTVDWTGTADTTFDNFYASANSNNFVGFIGVPQVVNLVPAVQTLFYTIPATNQITFTASTFNTNQINTNTLKLFLNSVDVSSQLSFTEVRDLIIGTHNTNFTVRFNGTLTSNTIYNGKIIVLDMSGKGTTNTWVFDTFRTNGTVTIEAEDFNYNAGQFQDNPPVSGLKPDGSQPPGTGGGVGYYDLVGQEDLDYHDTHRTGIDPVERNQYRTMDFAGTTQARMQRDRDVRQQYRDADVGEYFVTGLSAGDWMNYTRTFPSGNYQVYLRCSSQKAQAVQFDEVTAGSATSNQTTVVRGLFLVPNTGGSSRMRYIPLTDAAGNIRTLSLTAAVKTFRVTDLESSQANTLDVGDLQLNYLLFLPASAASSPQRPFVGYASPAGGTVIFDPEGTAQISIVNPDSGTSVNPGSVQLKFDGVNVTGSATITPVPTGASISYKPPGFLLPNSTHTLNVAFSDSGSVSQTNQWSFAVINMPTLLASDRESTGPDNSFAGRIHKAQDADPTAHTVGSFNNNISRAERQLAGTLGNADTLMPFVNEADTNGGLAAVSFVEPTAIHYEQCGFGTPLLGQAKPYPLINLAPYPSCDQPNQPTPDHFAIAASIKLSLAAGIYRMGFDADDEVLVQAGPAGTNWQGFALSKILGSSETIPGERRDDSGQGQFNFAVQTNGVYNFRIIQEEGGGSAWVDWFWVNRATGARDLVRPMALESAPAATGPYATESGALINPSAHTITLPKSGSTRFYRLRSSTAYTLSNPSFSGNNVVLNYQ